MTSIIYSNSIKQKQQQQQQKESNSKNIQKRLYRESFDQPLAPPAPPPRNYFAEKILKKHQKEIETIDDTSVMDEDVVPQQTDKIAQELLINIDTDTQESMDIIDECEKRRVTQNTEHDMEYDTDSGMQTQQVEELNNGEVEEDEEDEEENEEDEINDFIRYQRSIVQNETDSDSDDSESEDYSNDDSDDSDYNLDSNSNNNINNYNSSTNESTIKRTPNGRYIFDNNSYFYQRQQQPKQYHIYADNSLRMELIEIITIMKNNEREKPTVEEVFVHEIIL